MSFTPTPFRPHPLVRGGHLQTIVGNFLPGRAFLNSPIHRVLLNDGDAIALHDDGPFPPPSDLRPLSGSAPTALLLHGLGGSHQSSYMLRASAKLRARGVRVFRMDLRGCGAGLGLARYPLHAGRSEDAAAALTFVHERCPHSPIHLVAFSMGANIALKLAGEFGVCPPPYLASVLAVSPPIDLVLCTQRIQQGMSQVYDRRFVKMLVKHIAQRLAAVPDGHYRPLVPRPRRLIDFDSLFTAPLSGFADVHDYYTRASSGPLLEKIAVPTLIVTAATDPIVPVASFEQTRYSPSTQLLITPCGGHLGFVAAKNHDPDLRWLDWRIVDWVLSHAPQHQPDA